MNAFRNFFTRVKNWWNRTPRAFTGTVLANRLGWQLVRVFWLNFWRRLGSYRASPEVVPYAEALRRDGIVLVPDFLPSNVYSEIRREFEKEAPNVQQKPLASKYIIPTSGKTRMSLGVLAPDKNSQLYKFLDTHIIKNTFVKEIGSTLMKHKIESYREPLVFINKKVGDEYPDLNSDIYYHADVSYPGVKAFYYLSDTDEGNGAFTYAKGTHKLTWKRLKWEYRKSIEHAKNRKRVGNPLILGDETGRSWHCLTRDEEKREGIKGIPMIGKANSLVVFNVMGFHRRGEYTSKRPREFVMAYYRE